MGYPRAFRMIVFAFCMAASSPWAMAVDSATAKTLMEGGKKSLNAKKWDEAVSMLRKALSEDPALIEAAYWLAAAEEKAGSETAALADFRQFLAFLDKKGEAATPEEKKLRPLAEKRVDALAAWEKEYLKIEEKYVGELLALAKDRSEKEPWVAVRALDLVLAIHPKHPAALAMREKIGGKGGGREGVELFPEVEEWRDLISERAFKPVDGLIMYSENVLTLDTGGSKYVAPRKPVLMGPSYAYEAEFRVLETYEDKWSVGLVIANNANESLYDITLSKAGVILRLAGRAVITRDLETTPVAPKELGTWRRLSVGVRGNTVQVWLDGKRLFEERIPDRSDLAGDLGFCMARSKSEWRVLRAGSL